MRRVFKILSMSFVAVAVILVVSLVGVRLLGVAPYVVLSGSMSPQYPVGSLIYVSPIAAEDIQEGDPITFQLNDNTTATHRVISIDEQGRCFYTKGDANESADGAPVPFDSLIGKPVFCIPMLGYIATFISAPPGIYLVISAVVIYLLLSSLPALLKKAEKRDEACQQKASEPCKAAKQKG